MASCIQFACGGSGPVSSDASIPDAMSAQDSGIDAGVLHADSGVTNTTCIVDLASGAIIVYMQCTFSDECQNVCTACNAANDVACVSDSTPYCYCRN